MNQKADKSIFEFAQLKNLSVIRNSFIRQVDTG
jgi:hypothetical protein